MPPGFRLPTDHASATPAEFFFPLGLDPAQVNRSYRGNHFLFCAARLRGGVPPGQLNRELVNLFDRWTHDEGLYPVDAQMTAFATSVREEIVGETRPALLTLLAASGLLLLIACVNIANLLLARGDGRQRELAIRAALGGSRRRLVRQLLTESLLLALVGGAAGLLVASFVLDGMAAMDLVRLPRAHTLGLDRTAVAFALGVSVITGTLFGLGPALRAAGTNLLAGLRDGAAGAGIGRGRRGVQGALVVAQLAMAVVLLSGAGLLLRSFLAMSSVDPGFEAAARLTFRLNVPQSSYPQTADVVGLFDRIVTELRAVPEIVNIGAVSRLPMDGEIGDWDFQIDGRPLEPGRHPVGDWKVVTGGYFQTMGMRLVSGRLISNADTADALQVAVINETLARQYWPGESPVGTRIRMLGPSQGDWVTIVGVVGDVRHEGPRGEVRGTYFRPHAQIANSTGFTMRAMSVVAHVRGEPAAAVGAVRTRMALIDPDLPLAQVQSLSAIVSGSVSGPRLTTVLTGTFALVALALAAVGLYGVISYLVSRRVRELGVRIALGARPLTVLGLVLGRGAVLVLIGLILGLGVSLACARLLATQLFGVSALDPATMVAVAVVLAVVALLAFLGPAWRAVRIDPMVALRSE
jgi:putative ABC transport system permease protein